MSYFVTGTDTGVGKTLFSSALLHGFASQGKQVAGFKPVAAGVDADGQNDDAKILRAASTVSLSYEQVNPYCLREAIAPHIAARNEGMTIALPRIVAAYREIAEQADEVIVEGAGGFIVPLNDTQTSADLAKELGLPVIVIVGMRLGCLNHGQLTVRALDDYGLKCAGWVANVVDKDMPALQENIAALRERIAAPLLGVVPFMVDADAKAAVQYLDLNVLGHDFKE
ncbi:MAG: dethiobiotin synthase [Gallionella sp.]